MNCTCPKCNALQPLPIPPSCTQCQLVFPESLNQIWEAQRSIYEFQERIKSESRGFERQLAVLEASVHESIQSQSSHGAADFKDEALFGELPEGWGTQQPSHASDMHSDILDFWQEPAQKESPTPAESNSAAQPVNLRQAKDDEEDLSHGKINEKYLDKPVEAPPAPKPRPAWVDALLELASETVFTPFKQFQQLAQSVYAHYHTQNKLPVFYMTIGGIIALLFGFGYLMQYVSSAYFEIVKWIAGFGFAAGSIWWGSTLIRRHKEAYSEFGSALLALGIALNYLVIYAMSLSSLTPWLSGGLSVVLMMANAVFGAWVALRYDTRIVALLALAGGACLPFFLQLESLNLLYWSSLWFMVAGSIWLSTKIQWQPLVKWAFALSIALLELAIWQDQGFGGVLGELLVFHGFAYLFFYQALFDGKSWRQQLGTSEAVLLAANLGLLLYNLYQSNAIAAHHLLGWTFLANALVFAGGYFLGRNALQVNIRTLWLVVSGAWVALAIPPIFGQELMGMAWGAEGIALLACGFLFQLPNLRREAYLLLAIAISRLGVDSWGIETVIFERQGLWEAPFFSFLSIGGILLGFVAVFFYLEKKESSSYEASILKGVKESISVWAWAVAALLGWHYLHLALFNSGLIGLPILMLWGNRQRLKLTELLGLACYAFPIIGLYLSATEVDSMRFSLQTSLGKIAYLEVALPLWALQLFVERLMPQSTFLPLFKRMRELFYIALPWAILSPIHRHAPEWLGIGIIGSSALSFGLYELLKKQPMSRLAKSWVRNQGYAIWLGGMAMLTLSTLNHARALRRTLWVFELTELFAIGISLLGMWAYLKFGRSYRKRGEIRFAKNTFEAISYWAVATIYTIANFYLNEAIVLVWFALSIATMLWAKRWRTLRWTEGLAWALLLAPATVYAVKAVGILASLENGLIYPELNLLEWSAYELVFLAEGVLLLWLLPKIAHSSKEKQLGWQALGMGLQGAFFILLPVLLLPTFWVQLPSYIATGWWLAGSIAFGIAHLKDREWVRGEMYLLISLAVGFLFIEPSVTGTLTGLAGLGAVFIGKKAYREDKAIGGDFQPLFTFFTFYIGLVMALLYGKLTQSEALPYGDWIGMILIGAGYSYLLVHVRSWLHAVKPQAKLAYFMGLAGSGIGLSFMLFYAYTTGNLPYLWMKILIIAIMLALKGLMAYRPEKVYLESLKSWWKRDLILFHIGCMVAYSSVAFAVQAEEWTGVVLTIILTLHAIILLFHAAWPRYRYLLRWATAVFVGAGLKLKFYDMANFPLVKQVIVLMIVGVLLLVGANVFSRVKRRMDDQSESLGDES